MLASKFGGLLNKHSSSDTLCTTIQPSLTEGQLNAVHISEDEVMEALCQLKKNESPRHSGHVFSWFHGPHTQP